MRRGLAWQGLARHGEARQDKTRFLQITERTTMKLFNYHLISDAEYRRIRQIDMALRRRFTPVQIEQIMSGRVYIAKNPTRKSKVA